MRYLSLLYNSTFVNVVLYIPRVCIKELGLDDRIAERGKNRLLFLFVPRHYMYNSNNTKVISRGQINIEVNRSEYTQWRSYAQVKDNGPAFICNHISAGSCFVDVGANIGVFSLNVSKWLVSKNIAGKVMSIEPHPTTYRKLKRNIEINHPLKEVISSYNIAVGDNTGQLFLSYDPSHMGAAHISAGKEENVVAVPTVTLDSFLIQEKVDSVDFIKIDVEGYEKNVLLGAADSLRRFRPKMYIEINEYALRQQDTSFAEILSLLKEYSYEVYIPISNKDVVPVEDYFKNESNAELLDIYCVPKTDSGN